MVKSLEVEISSKIFYNQKFFSCGIGKIKNFLKENLKNLKNLQNLKILKKLQRSFRATLSFIKEN